MHGLVYSGPASCPNHITAALSLILNPSIQSHPNQIQRNMKVKLWFPIALLVLALEFNRLCWTGSLEKSTQKSCLSTALALSLVGTGWRVPGKTLLFVMKPSYWSHEHLVTASQHSGLNLVAIFTILTPQSPVSAECLATAGWPADTLNRWQFLGICDKLVDIFYWDGNKTLAAVAPMSGPAVLVMTRGWLFCVLMAPAPVAPDEGCWRTVLRELSGLATAMGPGSTERVVLCHEESANSLHVTPAAHLARATTKISNIHFTTIQLILNMFSTVLCITCQSNLGFVPGFNLIKSIIH